MKSLSFLIEKPQSLSRVIWVCLLIFAVGFNSFAQYQGAPVKKDKLLKALRSKQLQTEDIVAIINSNGVDFILTPDVRRDLITAGARPAVINAAASNLRTASNKNSFYAGKDSKRQNKVVNDYNDLLEMALYSYKEQKNPASAIRYLNTAVKLKPKDSKAYQMLAFINLYGLSNIEGSQKYMRESILNGGSAVFRVYHDDNGNFTSRCSGSLYISPEKIRFESDDNVHTFETSTVNVNKIKTDTESSKIWKKYPIFKVELKFGKEKAKFRFAPISGSSAESNLAANVIAESHNRGFNGATALIRY